MLCQPLLLECSHMRGGFGVWKQRLFWGSRAMQSILQPDSISSECCCPRPIMLIIETNAHRSIWVQLFHCRCVPNILFWPVIRSLLRCRQENAGARSPRRKLQDEAESSSCPFKPQGRLSTATRQLSPHILKSAQWCGPDVNSSQIHRNFQGEQVLVGVLRLQPIDMLKRSQ